MIRVLIVSRNESDNTLIQKKIEPLRTEFGAMQFYSARPANLTSVLDIETNLMIYNGNVFNSNLKNMAHKLRNIGYFGPMIVAVKIPDLKALSQFRDAKNVVLLEKPYERKDLIGIARKFLKDATVHQRRHRRFETEQNVYLESYQRDFSATTCIQNISRGGIYVQGALQDMSQGDLLRVNFDLDKINKSHTMSARVVWTQGRAGSKNRAAGLQFMTKEAVYGHLLSVI